MSLYTPDLGRNTGFDYSIVTDSSNELIGPSEIIERMNLTDVDDQVISEQIRAVRIYLEKVLNMTLSKESTITAYWESFAQRIPLPYGPVSSVTSVTRVAFSDGTETALTTSDYWVEGVSRKNIVMRSVYTGYGLKVVYVTGITDIPTQELVKDAIKSEVMEWYYQRGNSDESQYVLGKIALSKLDVFRLI